jgi:hypothetical protein
VEDFILNYRTDCLLKTLKSKLVYCCKVLKGRGGGGGGGGGGSLEQEEDLSSFIDLENDAS